MRIDTKIMATMAGMISVVLLSTGIAVASNGSTQPGGGAPGVEMLAIQKVDSVFPPGLSPTQACLFVNQIHQGPGGAFQHRHQAGAVYAVANDVRLTIWQDGLAPTDPRAESTTANLAPGQGAIIPTHWWHRHSNPGASTNTWWFLAALGADQCAKPPVKLLFTGPTVPFKDGPSLLKLFRTTFEAGQHDAQAGPEMTESFVLRGHVNVDGSTYGPGQGFYHSPGSVLHLFAGEGAQMLSYSIAVHEPRQAQ